MRKPNRQQLVMEVVAIPDERRSTCGKTLHGDSDRIQERHTPEKKHQERTVGSPRAVGKKDGPYGQIVPEKLASCITHEDPSGVGVEPKKTQHASQDGHHQENQLEFLRQIGQIGNAGEAYERQSSRETIESIGQVYGVGHPNDDQKSQRNRQPFGNQDLVQKWDSGKTEPGE